MPESPVRELRLALTVERYEEAVAFYRDLLGLPVLESFEGPGGGVVLDAGRVALEVADSAELASRLAAAGAEPLADPVVTPLEPPQRQVARSRRPPAHPLHRARRHRFVTVPPAPRTWITSWLSAACRGGLSGGMPILILLPTEAR